ncbi:MAG: roadblock/LC7 domain-containing protein [Desulfobacter sp.]|nr:MAG: roadblock/LC7 domain-containing protein [Desulfobacter sp.]
MRMAEVLSNVKRINGVDGYILLDGKGNILAHNDDMKAPEKLSRMVYFCGRKLSVIGKKYFKYASFSRQNNRNVLIFPVGNYYLGVIKQTGIRNFRAASAVMEFLDVLVGKSD